MRKCLLALMVLLIASAANAALFDWDPARLNFDNNGNNQNSVSVTTPELFGKTFDIGGAVDTSGKNDVNFEGTFDKQDANQNGNLAFTGVGNGNGSGVMANSGGTHPVPEAGTLILLSTGLLGLVAARRRLFKLK